MVPQPAMPPHVPSLADNTVKCPFGMSEGHLIQILHWGVWGITLKGG
jgi:hypothetical protein